ncbi:MAG: excinuclease ABC subunit A, partial [Verrucomicrobia bacterium]|nr:excinuclease ABC subunit A [Verrucomicrobiota bacterium]
FESEYGPAPLKSLKIPASHPLDSVRIVDQSPLSRTPRSTPVVYLGAFELIRKLFATSPDGTLAGLTPGYFSFNSGAGRCERCWGNGFEKVEMQFLSDLYLTCPECNGSRYTTAALEFRFEDETIADILNLTVSEAIAFFKPGSATTVKRAATKIAAQKAKILNILTPLSDLGLGYLRLGQPLNTLSGGEAQRLKLCTILLESTSKTSAPQRGKFPDNSSLITDNQSALLILDEPTTGLHFGDIEKLLAVFQRLVDSGHSLLVIEHNLDVIKSADHILDIGPGPGTEGGQIVATGTPEQVAATNTETARFLAPLLHRACGVPPQAVTAASRRESPSSQALKAAEPNTKYNALSPNNPITNNSITIAGAREHNLKNIDLVIPRDTFVVVTGLSGSGKSTLAFDIIFAEGQRRFLDSMSPYARQFAEQMEKPDIDRISGLPPTVAIEQRISRGGGKSTVATVTEIYHFLRLLFAKLGIQHCPESGVPVVPQTEEAITQTIRDHLKKGPLSILAPMIRGRKGFHSEIADWAGRHGYSRLFVDGAWKDVEGFQRLERFKEHDLDIEIARFDKAPRSLQPLRDAIHDALKIGKGTLRLIASPNPPITNNSITNNPITFSTARVSPVTGRSFEVLDPSHFSFNSPRGWCKTCRGYGEISLAKRRRHDSNHDTPYNSITEAELDYDRKLDKADDAELTTCPDCLGARLNEVARAVHLPTNPPITNNPITNPPITIQHIAALPVTEAAALIDATKFTGRDAAIARDILPEISQRLRFLHEVGLSYLQLDRSAKTLSGGEAQRIRLAAQLGSNLCGVLYVLDEPTIGLHPRDNAKLLDTLEALRLKGNSLLVVEHDDDTMSRAGHIIDLGPAAGRFGGEVIASGTLAQIKKNKASVTGHALKHPLLHPLRGERRPLPKASATTGWLKLKGCHANNLKNINAAFPVGRLTVLTGISGCGKSSLMHGCLSVAAVSNRQAGSRSKKAPTTKPYKSASGFKQLKAFYEVDQSPIGKTSRSCPATYVKLFDEIRKLFAQLPEARLRGFDASRFSFNNEPGRCPECRGNGRIKLEMDFLPSTWTHCEACNGKRYNPATLEVRYNHKSIGDILEMTIDEAAAFFESPPRLQRPLQLLADTGLGYLQLGQASPTLSGGEAQRLKLVTELTKGRSLKSALRNPTSAIRNLYLIEEPSIGLHLEDVRKLIDVLHRLVDEGHTVVVIEHHTGIMAEADYLIDLGPEAGAEGGTIVAHGTPEQVAKCRFSRTAPFLREVLQ